ncbi:MAG: hypothetical protein QOE82_2832 [Thermoanaerobaculia bacterium]|jgi:hypothetical protein|nr:hypothetical protein [Thermoanaerobaculia bacterium]
MKMNEFRSQQPLNEADFAAIRRNVMTTIVARNERRFLPIVMRFAIAAAVVIAIGLAFIARRPVAPVTTARKPEIVKAPIAVVAAPAPAPVTPVVVVHHPRHRRATHPRAQYASAPQPNIRVEFRTSDPDVRIIWIASQTSSTTNGGKS